MKCQNCEGSLKEGAVFCTQCGFRVPPLAVPVELPEPPPAPAPPKIPAAFMATPSGSLSSGDGYRIAEGPAFAVLTVYLQDNQSMTAESGAMVAMSSNIELQSEMKGGLMGALKRKITGESIFQSTFTARGRTRRSSTRASKFRGYCSLAIGRSYISCAKQFVSCCRFNSYDGHKIRRSQRIFCARRLVHDSH